MFKSDQYLLLNLRALLHNTLIFILRFCFFLAEVQEAISSKAGNVTFLKKINLEKGGYKYLVSFFDWKTYFNQ